MYQQLLHCLLRLVFCAQSEKRLRRLHFEQAYKEHIRASFTAEVLQLIKSHSSYPNAFLRGGKIKLVLY